MTQKLKEKKEKKRKNMTGYTAQCLVVCLTCMRLIPEVLDLINKYLTLFMFRVICDAPCRTTLVVLIVIPNHPPLPAAHIV